MICLTQSQRAAPASPRRSARSVPASAPQLAPAFLPAAPRHEPHGGEALERAAALRVLSPPWRPASARLPASGAAAQPRAAQRRGGERSPPNEGGPGPRAATSSGTAPLPLRRCWPHVLCAAFGPTPAAPAPAERAVVGALWYTHARTSLVHLAPVLAHRVGIERTAPAPAPLKLPVVSNEYAINKHTAKQERCI